MLIRKFSSTVCALLVTVSLGCAPVTPPPAAPSIPSPVVSPPLSPVPEPALSNAAQPRDELRYPYNLPQYTGDLTALIEKGGR